MGYEATQNKYVSVLLLKLTENQRANFTSIGQSNKRLMYTLSKQKNELLNDLWWLEYESVSVDRIYEVVCLIGHEISKKLYKIIPPEKITKYNARYLNQFSMNVHLLLNDTVKWGIGNYNSVAENIEKHYKKHVLCPEEGIFWSKQGINSASDYALYAVKMFHYIEKIMVHTNGCGVYMSGFFGKVFIIGRYDSSYNFGISSCYYVESGDKPGRESGLCFSVSKLSGL